MTILAPPFADRIAAVEAQILVKIEAARAPAVDPEPAGVLADVAHVVFGAQEPVGKLVLPALWIIPAPHFPILHGGHRVQHDLTYDFVAMVLGSKESTEDKRTATRLAGAALDVMIADRQLNGTVFDVYPTRWDPAYSQQAGNNRVFVAAAQLAFRIEVRQ